MRAYRQLLLAQLREFLRDRPAVFWNFAFIGLFALAFTIVALPRRQATFRVGISQPTSALEQSVADALRAHVLIAAEVLDEDQAEQKLRGGTLDALVRFDWGTAGANTAAPQVVLTLDRRNPETPIVASIIGDAVRIATQALGGRASLSLTVHHEPQSHPHVIDLFIPGLLAMLVMRLGLFNTPHPIISFRIQGITRRLRATPASPVAILASHLTLRVLIVLAQVVIIGAAAYLFWGLHLENARWLAFGGLFLLSSAAFIAVGLVIASVSRTQETGNAIGGTVQIPFLILSGVLVPVNAMPTALQPLVFALPTTHVVDAFSKTLVAAAPVYSLGMNIAVLIGWLAVCGVLAARMFSER